MLTFREFQTYVLEHIKEELPINMQDPIIRMEPSIKENNQILQGISIKEKDSIVAPVIYLDHYYHLYLEGESLSTVLKDIAAVSFKERTHQFDNIANDFLNYDFVKDKIVMSLVNQDENPMFLSDVPYMPKEDLAIIYKVLIDNDIEGMAASVNVKKNHLEMWNVTISDIHEAALKNSNNLLPAVVTPLFDAVNDFDFSDEMVALEFEKAKMNIPLDEQIFIISNKLRLNGAATMIYSDALKHLSKMIGSDLYILPSSRHEVLAISTKHGDPNLLRSMTQEVNKTLEPGEFLSDNIYQYIARTNEISLVKPVALNYNKRLENDYVQSKRTFKL